MTADLGEIKRGRAFLHRRQITRSSTAANPVPEPCVITRIARGRGVLPLLDRLPVSNQSGDLRSRHGEGMGGERAASQLITAEWQRGND